jgi:nucleoside-triphosphatase THEP1
VHGKSVSMTGEPGSGKSKLIKTLLSGLEQKSFRQDRPSVKS